jgi:hypothetical protein
MQMQLRCIYGRVVNHGDSLSTAAEFCHELADADNDFRLTTKRNAGAAATISLMVQRAHFSIRRKMSAQADKPWH